MLGLPQNRTPPRIVSLVPSATEIVALLGADRALVGRSHECDYPPSVAAIPMLTGQATHAQDPASIDRAVRQQLAAGSPLYTLDARVLAALRPDIIITQDLCSVCSIDLAAVRRAADSLPHKPIILSLNPTTIDGVLDDILTVGRTLGLEDRARDAVVRLRERLHAASEFVNPFVDGPNIAFLEWTDPLFIGGHWTAQFIERAGGRHPLNPTVAKEHAGAAAGPQQAERVAGKSIAVPPEVVLASRPDRVIVCPCGFDLAKTRAAVAELESKPWWHALPAVKNSQVALVDGNQMFNRPGPRLIDAFEWLVGWLHEREDLIPTGFPWERWEMEH